MINRHRLTPEETEKIVKGMHEHEKDITHLPADSDKMPETQQDNAVPSEDITETTVSSESSMTNKEKTKRKQKHKKNMFSSDDSEEEHETSAVFSYDPVIISIPSASQTEPEERKAQGNSEISDEITPNQTDAAPQKAVAPKNDRLEETKSEKADPKKAEKKEDSFSDADNERAADEFIAELRKTTIPKEQNVTDREKFLLNKKDKLRYGFIIVCIAVFIVCMILIAIGFASGKSAKSLYSDLQSDFLDGLNINSETPTSPDVIHSIATPPFGAERNNESNLLLSSNNELYSQIRAKLTSYKNSNQDIYGWITVEGTNINYVVLKGDDNSYYLDHTYNKAYNPLGAIFVDFRCLNNAIDNKNLVVYGHFASYYKQMFYEISKFLNKEFFDKNKTITLYTLDGILTYEIFAIYETEATYNYVNPYFATDVEFETWANEVKSKSLYVRNTEPLSISDRIITLSTCTNGLASRRYALQARLVNVE